MGLFEFFRRRPKPIEETKGSDKEGATNLCFVLCESAEPGDLTLASQVVTQVFGGEYSAEIGEKSIVSVARGAETVGFLAHMPAPIPGDEATQNAAGNFLWPEGESDAARHKSHVVVIVLSGEEQTPIQSALLVSKMALIALRLFDGIGVYWGNASVCNSRKTFEGFCEEMSEEHLPIPVWLRFQVIRPSEDELGMYTIGMKQFGLMEIEVDDCQMDLQELFEFVSNLAHYLILSGPVIADGNTVGGTEDERILVRHRPSMIDRSRRVYKIIFG